MPTRFKAAIVVFISISLLCLTAVGQAPSFVGTWKTRVNPTNGKAAFTLEIENAQLKGQLVVLNPDGTEMHLSFLNPELLDPKTFRFRTEDDGFVMEWHLFLQERANEGLLRGSDRRPGKFGPSNGELLIEEKVTKQK